MYVHPLFFSRKEEEPVTSFSEYRRTHAILCFRPLVRDRRLYYNDKGRSSTAYRAVANRIAYDIEVERAAKAVVAFLRALLVVVMGVIIVSGISLDVGTAPVSINVQEIKDSDPVLLALAP